MIQIFGSYQFAMELTKEMVYLQLFGKEQIIPSPAGWTAILYGKSEPVP